MIVKGSYFILLNMILDGRKIAAEIIKDIRTQIARLPFTPVFCDILVGSDPASEQYVKMKARAAASVGIQFKQAEFSSDISENGLVNEINRLNEVPNMCGLIVQLPLPQQVTRQSILDAIDIEKDVDVLSTRSSELFYSGNSFLVPPTAGAVMAILDSVDVDFSEKQFVVVGQGMLVGKPVSYLLRQKGYSVTVVDKNTSDISLITKTADVLISGTGQPGVISGDMLKPGGIVIDAGTAEMDGGIVGDVNFASVDDVAAFISPVPGGVGPVTVAMLLKNVLKVAQNR